jgi:hypothetical protein
LSSRRSRGRNAVAGRLASPTTRAALDAVPPREGNDMVNSLIRHETTERELVTTLGRIKVEAMHTAD